MLLEQTEKLVIDNNMTDPRMLALLLGVILIIIFADYVIEMYICARSKSELYNMKREVLAKRRSGKRRRS